jgi:hypothetical protein
MKELATGITTTLKRDLKSHRTERGLRSKREPIIYVVEV